MQITVCDMIMGAGKTSAAINRMIEDTDSTYIFITPFLEEVERVKESCTDRHFYAPEDKGNGKLDNLHYLLGRGVNITSTHALFQNYTEYTLELIRNGNYKLILDEVFNVVEVQDMSKKDIDLLLEHETMMVDNDCTVHWLDDDYSGRFHDLKYKSRNGNLLLYKESMMLWLFPLEVFKAFEDVLILTYMFDAQIQKYYYDMNNVDIKYVGTTQKDGQYCFSEASEEPEYVKDLINKIHILDDRKLNKIGGYRGSISSTWFDRELKKRDKPLIQKLKANLYNVFRHKFAATSQQCMWTTYVKAQDFLKGNGYTSGFVACNKRATNKFRHKTHLAYCVNIHFNPMLKGYFLERGIAVMEDRFALSELVQWIWRSAIRDRKEIWIYIPSKRMRQLLENWLAELAEESEDGNDNG